MWFKKIINWLQDFWWNNWFFPGFIKLATLVIGIFCMLIAHDILTASYVSTNEKVLGGLMVIIGIMAPVMGWKITEDL